MQIKFVFETEKELIDITIDEFEFYFKEWLNSELKISIDLKNKQESLYLINKLEDIKPGFFEISVSFGNSGAKQNISEENISSLILHVVMKMCSVSYCGIMLSEIPADDIIIKKKGKKKSNNVKIDQFRFIEEIDYAIKIFQNFKRKKLVVEGLFSKISIYLDKKTGLNRSDKKSINDLILKTLNEHKIISKDELPERNNYNLNEFTQNYFFKIMINPSKILFIANFRNELFQRLVYLGKIQTHPTPLAPHIASALILFSLNNVQNIEFMKNETHSERNKINVMFIDPFCGYGTIPLIFYINTEFFLNFLSSKIENRIKKKFQIKSVEILGFDSDNKAIEVSNQNIEKISKFNKNLRNNNAKSLIPKISVSFDQAEINSVFQKISAKITANTLTILVTQPPYGFTMKYPEEVLKKVYYELSALLQNLRKMCPLSVALISTRKDLMNKIKKNMEFAGDIEQIALKNQDMVKIQRAGTFSFIFSDIFARKKIKNE